jgi:hypothetical protein
MYFFMMFIFSGYDDDIPRTESLLSLVLPELTALVGYWLAALRDAALLSLPALFTDQLPAEGGAFFKMESAEVRNILVFNVLMDVGKNSNNLKKEHFSVSTYK